MERRSKKIERGEKMGKKDEGVEEGVKEYGKSTERGEQ